MTNHIKQPAVRHDAGVVVRAGRYWIETSGGTVHHFVRNGAQDHVVYRAEQQIEGRVYDAVEPVRAGTREGMRISLAV